jgi:RNA polymerase sigma-B factor
MATHMAPTAHDASRRPPQEREHIVFRRYRRTGDPSLRDALIERYLPLARHLARRYPSGGEDEDLLQVASLGLMKAVDRFDPDRGIAFTSFATPTILGELKRYFRDYGWAVRVPRRLQEIAGQIQRVTPTLSARLGRKPTARELAETLDVSLEDIVEALGCATAHRPVTLDWQPSDGEDPLPRGQMGVEDPGFASVEDASHFDALLDLLPESERVVMELRFRHDLVQREIAGLVGISQMQVSRRLASAVERLNEIAVRPGAAAD